MLGIAMRLFATLALAAATLSPAQGAQLIFAYGITGTCDELSVDGTDITNACRDAIAQVGYDDDRFGVIAYAGDKIITFSGSADTFFEDDLEQPVDALILTTEGSAPLIVTARGTCLHGDIFAGRTRFECTGKIKGSEPFRLVFSTDGGEPTDEIAQ